MTLSPDLLSRPGTVLLDTSRPDAENRRSLLFTRPLRVLRADHLGEVMPLLATLDEAVRDGYHVAGYLAYEAGHAFERIAEGERGEQPLAWMGVYAPPAVLREEDVRRLLGAPAAQEASVRAARFETERPDYLSAVADVKAHIREGDVYQVNLTGPVRFRFDGSPVRLYRALRRRQRVPYAAYVHTGAAHILSFSPELFFRRAGRRLWTRPMKGTARRGCTQDEDERLRRRLAADAKNRAENLMIVDLLRNDLSICCVPGSVRVPRLFTVESYETVHQMTSTVEGRLKRGASYADLFRALFPCGSVTGAPKIRAMQMIDRLERGPRGVYCGAIGYAGPDAQAVFNVAIRTVVLREGAGTLGVGSGLVWDSDAGAEYDECLLKADFLTGRPSAQVDPESEDFELIETLRGKGGALPLADRHAARLKAPAAYFGFLFDEGRLRRQLEEAARALDPEGRYKVRVTLDRAGRFAVTQEPLEPSGEEPLRVLFARERADTGDPFFYHKTTHRRVYERAYREARAAGCDEALLLNERGEVTEGTRANLFVAQHGAFYTPPVESGLLGGVYRQQVLDACPEAAVRVLTPQDVREADRLYLCNAVRGVREAVLVTR